MKLKTLPVLILFFSVALTNCVYAQVTGKITDTKGEPIPFANVIIESTTKGTTANAEGEYTLDVEKGQIKVGYQSIGYQKTIRALNYSGSPITINVVLQPSSIQLSEFVVRANAEDPAYAIIRQAILKRAYFREQVKAYSTDVYIKGIQKIIKAPQKILGRNLGDLGGSLDSNRQGIVYLSETVSKYFVQLPKNKKEEVISAKVSGRDNSFGFNRATIFDFSFYDNHIEIQRQTLSPLAGDALLYYKYKLIGTIKDSAGYTINKIEVIPKRKEDPTWGGFIYIVDNLWNIASVDLYLTGKSIQIPILDTLRLRQNHVLVQAPDVWKPVSQTIDFTLSILGLGIKGNFSGVFSNYNLQPNFDKNFFGAEVFKAERDATGKNSAYWDSLRPMPLTLEEKKDYVRKDSIKIAHESKTYKDSVDWVANQFSVGSLFLGYNHQNSEKRLRWNIASPISTISLNPVQGWNIDLPISFTKSFNADNTRVLTIAPTLNYGFSEKNLRADVSARYRFNNFNRATLSFSGGKSIVQFNLENPISHVVNEIEMAFYDKSYIRLYNKIFAKAGYTQELVNGLYLNANLEVASRNNLDVHYFRMTDTPSEQYFNSPVEACPNCYTLTEANSNILQSEVKLSYHFNQKYATYPKRKQIESDANAPIISFTYQKGYRISESWSDFDKIKLGFEQRAINFGLVGTSEFNLIYGAFINDKNKIYSFADLFHFNGNQTIFGSPATYMRSFFLLPYYRYSTNSDYFEAHYQHHFNGFFFDKIPLLNKLGASEVIKVSYLNTRDLQNYWEFSVGLDNLGIGLFKIFRVDIAKSLQSGQLSNTSVIIGVKL